MQLIPNATIGHAAESCYVCHRDEPMVDTDVVIEGEGTLAICVRCVREMAAAAGFDVIDVEEWPDDPAPHPLVKASRAKK